MMNRLLAAFLLFASTSYAADAYLPTDAERARWTMSDMNSWRIVFEAYRTDNQHYPVVSSPEAAKKMAEPVYIRNAPLTDAWGHPYRIESDGTTFRVVSAGADGRFDQSSWSTPAKDLPFDADAVVTNEGRWLFRSWSYLSEAGKTEAAIRDMRALRTAIEGYAHVHNAWPTATNMKELRPLLQPDYIRFMPSQDPWGHDYVYTHSGDDYRVVSLGPDGKPRELQ